MLVVFAQKMIQMKYSANKTAVLMVVLAMKSLVQRPHVHVSKVMQVIAVMTMTLMQSSVMMAVVIMEVLA